MRTPLKKRNDEPKGLTNQYRPSSLDNLINLKQVIFGLLPL